MKSKYLVILLCGFLSACSSTKQISKDDDNGMLKALIIDGQNNHDMWPKTTVMMKQYLEETGLFTVDVERTAFTWNGDPDLLAQFTIEGLDYTSPTEKAQSDPEFNPKFSDYDVVVSNFGWGAAPLPTKTQKNLEKYVSNGGGFVIIHAANNSWPEWLEFNKMIALGGWGDRTEKDGPYVYHNLKNELVRDESAGKAGSHGPQHEFLVWHKEIQHPITAGLPELWMHAKDELYDRLRGPALNLKVLATSFSDPNQKGTNRHEPMIMAIDYGEGRVFHTPLGHADYSFECVGFITLLKRGVEWAATSKVSLTEIPTDFPGTAAPSTRPFISSTK